MHIGIVVLSQTGHTESVAIKLKEKLAESGHTVGYEKLQVKGEMRPDIKTYQFEKMPDLTSFAAVVFAAPVMAFSLNPAMKYYLSHIPTLAGKKAAFLVTEQFPFPWLGGNRAVRQMTKLCGEKGAQILGSIIVNWSNSRREQQIEEGIDKLNGIFCNKTTQ